MIITPKPGQVLWCNYDDNVNPEMQGRHMVVVISSKTVNRRGTSIVVPVSSKQPNPFKPWHLEIDRDKYPFFTKECWFKGNLLGHVRNNRFDRIRILGVHQKPELAFEDLEAVRACAIYSISHRQSH